MADAHLLQQLLVEIHDQKLVDEKRIKQLTADSAALDKVIAQCDADVRKEKAHIRQVESQVAELTANVTATRLRVTDFWTAVVLPLRDRYAEAMRRGVAFTPLSRVGRAEGNDGKGNRGGTSDDSSCPKMKKGDAAAEGDALVDAVRQVNERLAQLRGLLDSVPKKEVADREKTRAMLLMQMNGDDNTGNRTFNIAPAGQRSSVPHIDSSSYFDVADDFDENNTMEMRGRNGAGAAASRLCGVKRPHNGSELKEDVRHQQQQQQRPSHRQPQRNQLNFYSVAADEDDDGSGTYPHQHYDQRPSAATSRLPLRQQGNAVLHANNGNPYAIPSDDCLDDEETHHSPPNPHNDAMNRYPSRPPPGNHQRQLVGDDDNIGAVNHRGGFSSANNFRGGGGTGQPVGRGGAYFPNVTENANIRSNRFTAFNNVQGQHHNNNNNNGRPSVSPSLHLAPPSEFGAAVDDDPIATSVTTAQSHRVLSAQQNQQYQHDERIVSAFGASRARKTTLSFGKK